MQIQFHWEEPARHPVQTVAATVTILDLDNHPSQVFAALESVDHWHQRLDPYQKESVEGWASQYADLCRPNLTMDFANQRHHQDH